MALFIHIAAKKDCLKIHRSGLKAGPVSDVIPHGVYAMPVVPNFYVAHQWVRELKRGGQRQMCGVYFRVLDDEEVWIGYFNRPHTRTTAAEAAGVVMHMDDAQGYQIIVPHSIAAQDIVKIRDLPHVGWRYLPLAHTRCPCGCEYCQKGRIKSRRIRKAYQASGNK